MTKHFFRVLLILNLLLLNTYASSPYQNIKYLELDNGLKLYMLSDTRAVNTQVDLEVGVGMSAENDENAGITHLLEHLLFRDARVPYRDYLDYLKEEGATYVNGYTQDLTTGYVATIDSNKSYFLLKEFAQMIFDKNVSNMDLEIEKKALQNEIGELKWYHYFGDKIQQVSKAFSESFPSQENIYIDFFKLSKDKERASSYTYKTNNIKFTLEDALAHYEAYYYPKNMTLKIVGNFDTHKMQALVQKYYGQIKREGTATVKEAPYNAQLKEKPYENHTVGVANTNMANIGTRYILDDYKKYLILVTYVESLSDRMQKLLRNKLGQTYSVSSYNTNHRNAGLAGIDFGALHDDFNENISLIQEQIAQDVKGMSKEEIQEALAQSELYYTSKEHDSKTLMELLDTQAYMNTYHGISTKTSYDIFKEITPQEYQEVVSREFSPKQSYIYTYKDYLFFPFDLLILSLFMLGLIIYILRKYSQKRIFKVSKAYTQRDVIMTRKLTPTFIIIVGTIVTFTITIFLAQWFIYYILLLLFNDVHYLQRVSSITAYIIEVFDIVPIFIIYITLAFVVFRKVYTKIDLTQDEMFILGTSLVHFNKSQIQEIKEVQWSRDKMSSTYGASPLFLKPLVQVKHSGGICYLRAKKADELTEDLNKWLVSS